MDDNGKVRGPVPHAVVLDEVEDREPQPSDGPEFHADHAAWVERNRFKPMNPEQDEELYVTFSVERFGRPTDEERRLFIKRMLREIQLKYPSAKAVSMRPQRPPTPAVDRAASDEMHRPQGNTD